MLFVRQKSRYCGDYREVDIIPRTDTAERAARGKRGNKKKITKPRQTELNHKNAIRYLTLLANGNFGKGDIHVSCTYDSESLPETVEEADRFAANYIARLKHAMKKEGAECRYILVTEYGTKKDGSVTRIHHHMILNGALTRDKVESLWKVKGKRLGWCNADKLQPDKNGVEALCKYLLKNPQGKKRYSSSRNLKRPYESRNDSKFTYKKVVTLAKLPDGGRDYFEKIYKGFGITDIRPVYYEETGWHIYLKMWKQKTKEKEKGEKHTWRSIKGRTGAGFAGRRTAREKYTAPPSRWRL